jgi:hypothetical protein
MDLGRHRDSPRAEDEADPPSQCDVTVAPAPQIPPASLPGAARCARRTPGPVPGQIGSTPAHSTMGSMRPLRVALPRKEVIQPQLPLRLPCYDFVPITSPTLGGCAPEGFAHRLQVLPAFVT